MSIQCSREQVQLCSLGKVFFFQGEEEADGEEDNEDDDGFFVPHGYLSDDEGVLDEEMEDDGESDKKVRYDRFNEYLITLIFLFNIVK